LDPYIIENLIISGFGIIDYGIDIRNSNVSFIIQECLIYNSDQAGIYLDNVNNSRLINNNCSNNDNGIYVEYSNNITIFENTANGNAYDGINAQEINYVNITGNTVNDNKNGIDISICNFSYIIENIANGNSEKGIHLEESISNTISGNNANGNEDGIYLYNADFNTIIENTVNMNDRAGIYLDESDYNDITGNTASGNNNGIGSDSGNNYNIITGNIFTNNNIGIEIYESNNANNNTIYGIYIQEESSNNTISGNSVNNNNNTGIYLEDDSDYNVITENTINNNNLGIYLYSNCGNNSIYRNLFLKNGLHAKDDGTDNTWNSTTIGNYWDNWTSPDISPNDGIVDDPYTYIGGSAGSIDYLPIAEDNAPLIVIDSPTSGSIFGVSAPSFIVRITDFLLDSMWYSLDGGLHNYTFTENGTINQLAWSTLSEGSVTITFYANDTVGNEASEDVIITKSIPDETPDMVIIIIIVVVSVVGGVVLISVVYIYLKKRSTTV